MSFSRDLIFESWSSILLTTVLRVCLMSDFLFKISLNVSVSETCFCKCNESQNVLSETNFKEMLKSLVTDVKKTSSYKRKKISVRDNRPGSQGLGSLGVAILIIEFSLIITADLPRLYTDLKMIFRRLKRRLN
ncbi:hypothetical protein KUTeg_019129 [Tegillarca granosa]|uniref:Uncharacterized protein n=1 Tax=Tegillarca granosa TaxID=220873 RepID=A0ABQ9EBM2_TEGGR|nr:hypothetical protein KUTeg_019129 [Tegillarca granosa]